MRAAVVDDVLVDLVGDGDDVPLAAERGHGLEVLAREDRAGRVVRIAQDDRLGPVVERGGQLAEVEPPVRRPERHEPRLGAGEDAVGPVVLVERLGQDHLVAGIDQREQRHQHRLGAAAGDGDLGLGVHPQAQVPVGVLGDRPAELVRAPGDCVLVDVGLDRAAGRCLDLRGGREVRHPLRQVHRAVSAGLDRHAPDHALGEPRGLMGDHRDLHRAGRHRSRADGGRRPVVPMGGTSREPTEIRVLNSPACGPCGMTCTSRRASWRPPWPLQDPASRPLPRAPWRSFRTPCPPLRSVPDRRAALRLGQEPPNFSMSFASSSTFDQSGEPLFSSACTFLMGALEPLCSFAMICLIVGFSSSWAPAGREVQAATARKPSRVAPQINARMP